MHAPLRRLGLLLVLCACVGLVPNAWAQSELVVAPGLGTLNDAVEGDTTATGERLDPDRVYVLQRGAYYGITRQLANNDFVLRIRAAEGEGERPVVYPGPDNAGETPGSRYLSLGADTYLSDIYFLGVEPEGTVVGIPGAINAEGQRLVIDNCVFEGGRSRWWEVNAEDTKILVRNSQFRNQVRYDNSSNARAFDYRTVAADTLLIENTSFLNVNGYLIRYDGTVVEHFIFNHNTVFLTNYELSSYTLVTQTINFQITNNLFVNPMAKGEAPPEDDGSRNGFLRVDSLDADVDIGFTEDDRNIRIEHNNIFFTQEVMDFYADRTNMGDPLQEVVLVEDATIEYGDVNPFAVVRDNINDPVTFVNPPSAAGWAAWYAATRDGAAEPPEFTFGNEDGLFPAEQPLPEDLAYATTDVAYTAAAGGFPLGDLNWFPQRKQDWIAAGGDTYVAVDDAPTVPDAFTLRGNYPNPFNPTTTILFDLAAPARVTVAVYDVLGRRVMTLPAQALSAGSSHRVAIDGASLSSGVYVYRVTAEMGADQQVQTGTMTLLK